MSWSLEVFSPRAGTLTREELTTRLGAATPPLTVAAGAPPAGAPAADAPSSDSSQTFLIGAAAEDETAPLSLLARVQVVSFGAEQEADPELLSTFEAEIAESDADDGELDEEYTARLRQMLAETRWHYSLSVLANDRPEQERAVVQGAYAISQIGGGIVHDLQSGAWMDAELFENLLDAYGVTDF